MRTQVITHRGLDPLKKNYFLESSQEAFADQLARGYGLEFDVRFTRDGGIVIIHDASLKRITGGTDTRAINELTVADITEHDFNGCHIITLATLLDMIEKQEPKTVSALHLKHAAQEYALMDLLLKTLKDRDLSRFMVFDVTIASASYLKKRLPELALTPSLSHPHDIERYNDVVGGTLLSLEEVLANRPLFDWVWLDEWDLRAKDGGGKKLITRELFDALRKTGLKIALVTPEMHASSPGLLGGEAHEDGIDEVRLAARLHEIVSLKPDAICTDRPDYVQSLVDQYI